MPSPRLTLALAMLAALAPWPPGSARALDLTPIQTVEVLDGVPLPRTAFADQDGQVLCDLPRGWSPQGTGRRLDLRPPDGMSGQGRIEALPSLAGSSLDLRPEEMKRHTSVLLAQLPPGATEASIGPIRPCELQMSGRPVYRADGTFVSHLRSYRAIFWLIPSAREGLRFSLFIRDDDQADATARNFERSLCSWTWPTPGE